MKLLTKLKKTGIGLFMLGVPLTMSPQANDSPRNESPRSGFYDDDGASPLEDTIADALITFQNQHNLEKKMVFEFDRAPWMLVIADVRESNSNALEKGCVYLMDVVGENSLKPTAHFRVLSVRMPQDGIGIFHGHIKDDKWSINLPYHFPQGADALNIVNLGEFHNYYEDNPMKKKALFREYFGLHKNFQQDTPSDSITDREKFILLMAYHRNFGLVGTRILY